MFVFRLNLDGGMVYYSVAFPDNIVIKLQFNHTYEEISENISNFGANAFLSNKNKIYVQ